MNKMIAFYHDPCSDGCMAAAVFLRRFPEAELIPLPAGTKNIEKYHEQCNDARVFFLDVAMPTEALLALTCHAMSITVIDHHELSKVQARDGVPDVDFVTDSDHNRRSGAQLTWSFLLPDEEEPDIVRWVGKRDLWVFDEPEVLPVSYALQAVTLDPVGWESTFLSQEAIEEPELLSCVLKDGRAIERYIESRLDAMEKRAYWMNFNGHRVVAINSSMLVSDIATRLYERFSVEESPFVVVWSEGTDGVYYSLRSRKDSTINLAEIAARYGGGGHFHAAGFRMDRGETPER